MNNGDSLGYLLPELLLAVGILILIALGASGFRRRRSLAIAILVVTCEASMLAALATGDGAPVFLCFGLLARDPFSDFFKLLGPVAAAAVALLAFDAKDALDGTVDADGRGGDQEAPEFCALLLGAVLGTNLMAAATDLLTAYLGLELVSIMSYLLAGFSRDSQRSAEAALKYVIYGGVASGVMLYGLSLFYGMAGSTDLTAVSASAAAAPIPLVVVAAVLVFAGVAYKIAVVPFHAWCPDVYEGGPTPVAAFLSVATKAGGVALLLRLFAAATPHAPVTLFVLVVGVATMTVGNLGALGQTNLKRLLAYSSIAHAGTMLLGLGAGGAAGNASVLFYLGVSLLANLTAFVAVTAVARATGGETLADYTGLGYRMPLCALALAIAMVALIGLPPTAGFLAKYYVFAALIERGSAGGTVFYVVAAIGLAQTLLSVGYYARVLKAMYLEGSDGDRLATAPAPAMTPIHTALLAAMALPTVALGVCWWPLREWVVASLAMAR